MEIRKVGKYSFNQFLADFNKLQTWLKSIHVNMNSFTDINQLSKDNISKLHQVLDASFVSDNKAPNKTPMLKYWIGEDDLSDKPLLGEQKLFDHILNYLCKYYNIKSSSKMLDTLQNEAMLDSNNILKNEKFYEMNQLFSAFGHTSTKGMQKSRLNKLMRYADDHIFQADMKILYDAIIICANKLRSDSYLINRIEKLEDNPFQSKGIRNVGTPFWGRTNLKINNDTLEQYVFNISNKLWKDGLNNLSISKYVNIPSTLFGRNSTKGVIGTWHKNNFKINTYEASPRVIYGVSLINNTQISRLYYSVMQQMKNQSTFSTLKGTEHLRSILPKIAALDKRLGVYRISTDKSRYDTTLSVELMICAAIIDMLSFGTSESKVKTIMLSLAIDALNPIYYKTEIRGKIKVLKTWGGHKSGFYNTFRWGSLIGFLIDTYGKLIIDRQWFIKTQQIYALENTPFSMFAGDDWSTVYKSLDHAKKAADIEEKHFGMISNIKKSAYGTWIVQNGCNSLGKVSYPLARALRSFYYPENSVHSKPPFVLLMTTYAAIELLWESPHLDYFIKEHVLKADKYKGGLYWDDKGLTFSQFYKLFVQQAQDYANMTHSYVFNENDPRWTDILKVGS